MSYIQIPHVNRTDYQLIDISEDGFVCSICLFACELLIRFWFAKIKRYLFLTKSDDVGEFVD